MILEINQTRKTKKNPCALTTAEDIVATIVGILVVAVVVNVRDVKLLTRRIIDDRLLFLDGSAVLPLIPSGLVCRVS